MPDTTTNMGLTRWTDTDDKFNHSELAENFHVIDIHNHADAGGVQIPEGGLAPNSVGTSIIKDSSITADKIRDGAVTAAKLAEGTISDSKLITSPFGNWSVIAQRQMLFGPTTTGDQVLIPFQLDKTYYQITGKPISIRVRLSVYTNATNPGIAFNGKLWPITGTAGAGAGGPSYSLGTASATSGALSPGASAQQHIEGSSVDFPVAGHFALGVNFSAALATNAYATVTPFLEAKIG